MKAVILVGGEGTRLRPLTYIVPKAMMPVLNIPFIHHMINHLQQYGINEIILSMGYKPEIIKSYFQNANLANLKLDYNIETRPMGTAGAVKFAQRFLEHEATFFVLNGDVFSKINLDAMLRFHQQHQASLTIALTTVDDPSHFGVVEIDTKQRIQRFIEKPDKKESPDNYINAGIYVVNYQVLDMIPENEHSMFEYDLFPRLLAEGLPVFGFIFKDYWIDMGNPQKYMQLNADLITGKCQQNICMAEAVNLSEQCRIHSQTNLSSPLFIDKCSSLDKDVIIDGPTIIGANCKIKSKSHISNSILWDRVRIGENTRIKNSIIANDCVIPNNTLVENEIICKGH